MKTYKFKVYFKKEGEPVYYYGQTFEEAAISATYGRIKAGLDTGIAKIVHENGETKTDVKLTISFEQD